MASVLAGKDAGISGTQVKRYIRLTEIIPELLEYVDAKKITIALAVEISYLDKTLQGWIYEYLKDNGFLKKEQIEAVRSVSNPSDLTQYSLIRLMNDSLPKPKENGKITFSDSKLREYFPDHFSKSQREEVILQLLKQWSVENNPLK
ncbi:MAG: hypothetical protein J6H31_08130 [Butyrivibrio sp.]|nr:hypothetical protein [Butyrivibrio sp.]